MLISQANPGWDLSDPTRAPVRDPRTLRRSRSPVTDGFKEFLLALREEVIRFRKPVAYVHGDSHYYRVDKPFQDAAGRRLENFTRIETFGNNPANGNNDVQWVKVHVDARSREVFAYEAQIVPAIARRCRLRSLVRALWRMLALSPERFRREDVSMAAVESVLTRARARSPGRRA